MLDELEGVIEFIDNVTHGEQHIPLAIQALQRNIHVQVEKPPALNWLETKQLVEAQKKSKAHFQLAEHVCFERGTLAMKDAIEQGLLGPIKYVEINFGHGGPYWPYIVSEKTGLPFFIDFELGGGGVLQDLGPHGISKAYWTLGNKIRNLRCKTILIERRKADRKMSGILVDSPAEDFAIAELTCLDGTSNQEFTMKCTNSWCGQPDGPKFVIEGEKGTMINARKKIIKVESPAIKNLDGKIKFLKNKKDKYHLYDKKIRETTMFADNILQGKGSICDAEYANRLQEIISLHYFSKLKGREVTLEEMDKWGEEILSKHHNDWRKASNEICKEFSKTVTILK
jgi:predicted dehydrogenase